VFKFGNFSNQLDAPFLTGCEGDYPSITPEKVWFVSMNLPNGASGSPVFYQPPTDLDPRKFRPMLIGVQSSSILKADVAAITPIESIYKIIQEMNLADADLRNDPYLSLPRPNPPTFPQQSNPNASRPIPNPQYNRSQPYPAPTAPRFNPPN
jgi:hypothetical protein